MDNLEVDSVTYQPETNLTWQPLYGERSSVRDHYRAGTLCLSKKDNSGYRLNNYYVSSRFFPFCGQWQGTEAGIS